MKKFKINRGTYNAISENIAQINENDLIITTDKNIPLPSASDNDKFVQVKNGDYSLTNPTLDEIAQGSTNKYLNATELTNVQAIPSLATAISEKQDKIDSSHKLDADLVDDTTSDNKFVSVGEKQTWNNKSSVSVSNTGTATDEVEYITIDGVEKKLGGAGIDDTQTSANKTWSSQKINTELGNKVDKVSSASKVYGTDANGNQTTYDLGSLGTNNFNDLSNRPKYNGTAMTGETNVVSSSITFRNWS